MANLILEPYIVRLWEEAGLKGDPHAVAADWEARYNEHGRFYHTPTHIKEGLDFLETPEFRCECDNPVLLKASWIPHDLEMKPGRIIQADELRSAELAATVYEPAGFGQDELYTGIVFPIIYTRHSVTWPNPTKNMRAIRDMDLWVIAQQWPRYSKYASDVANEWIGSGLVTPEAYIRGRMDFLYRTFLDIKKGQIFYTNYCRRNFTEAAVENVRREIDILKSGGVPTISAAAATR